MRLEMETLRDRAESGERDFGGIEGGDGGLADAAGLYSFDSDLLTLVGLGALESVRAVLPQ